MNVRLSATEKIKIANSDDVVAIMQRVLLRESRLRRTQEHFWILCLAQNNRLLNLELIGLGGLTSVPVEPMEVFSIALQKRAAKVIMVHNHPSGDVVPSKSDLDLTDRMIQVGNFLNVPVLDHFIITDRAWHSFLDSGLLEALAKSKKYVLPYKEQERLLAQAKAIGRSEGEAQGREAEKLQVALAMKAEGLEASAIARITGLSLAKVKGLKVPPAKASARSKA